MDIVSGTEENLSCGLWSLYSLPNGEGVQQLLAYKTVFKQSLYVYYLSQRTELWIGHKYYTMHLSRTYCLAREGKIFLYETIWEHGSLIYKH